MKQIIVTFEAGSEMEAVLARNLQQYIFEAVKSADGEIKTYYATGLPSRQPQAELQIPGFLKRNEA